MKIINAIRQAEIPVTVYVFSISRLILLLCAFGCIYGAFHLLPFQTSNLLMLGMGCYVLWIVWKEIPDIIKAIRIRKNNHELGRN